MIGFCPGCATAGHLSIEGPDFLAAIPPSGTRRWRVFNLRRGQMGGSGREPRVSTAFQQQSSKLDDRPVTPNQLALLPFESPQARRNFNDEL